MNEDNGKGYGCVVMALAGVALLVALIALRRWDIPMCAIKSSDFNVVDILSVLVTVLIGWQVYNAIENSKMIRRMDRLKSELDRRSNIWTQRNLEIEYLVDAHSHYQAALNSEFHSDSYRQFANALNLFLQSKVSLDYRPLQLTLQGLVDSLVRIESESREDDIENFIDSMVDYDDLYDAIIASIHQREQDIERLHRELLHIRSERLALRDRLTNRHH